MATRLAFSIDLDRCIGCQACVVACRSGNEVPIGDTFTTVSDNVRTTDNGLWGSFQHHRCFHCADAPCVAVCPTGTLSKIDGLTAVDHDKCSACGYCTQACPYDVPHIVDNHVSKCIGCLDLAKKGEQPWCARTCPSRAISFGDRDQVLAAAKAKVEKLKGRYPNAQVYGEDQLGGLGLLYVLLDKPDVYGLAENPKAPMVQKTWTNVVKPASSRLTALSAAAIGLAFVFARRTHAKEHAEHLAAHPIADEPLTAAVPEPSAAVHVDGTPALSDQAVTEATIEEASATLNETKEDGNA